MRLLICPSLRSDFLRINDPETWSIDPVQDNMGRRNFLVAKFKALRLRDPNVSIFFTWGHCICCSMNLCESSFTPKLGGCQGNPISSQEIHQEMLQAVWLSKKQGSQICRNSSTYWSTAKSYILLQMHHKTYILSYTWNPNFTSIFEGLFPPKTRPFYSNQNKFSPSKGFRRTLDILGTGFHQGWMDSIAVKVACCNGESLGLCLPRPHWRL